MIAGDTGRSSQGGTGSVAIAACNAPVRPQHCEASQACAYEQRRSVKNVMIRLRMLELRCNLRRDGLEAKARILDERLVRRVLRIRTSMKGRIGALREPSVLAKVRVDRPIGLRWPLDVLVIRRGVLPKNVVVQRAAAAADASVGDRVVHVEHIMVDRPLGSAQPTVRVLRRRIEDRTLPRRRVARR